jgi:hypothetical protein
LQSLSVCFMQQLSSQQTHYRYEHVVLQETELTIADLAGTDYALATWSILTRIRVSHTRNLSPNIRGDSCEQ